MVNKDDVEKMSVEEFSEHLITQLADIQLAGIGDLFNMLPRHHRILYLLHIRERITQLLGEDDVSCRK